MLYKKISWLQASIIGLLLTSNTLNAKLDINFSDGQKNPEVATTEKPVPQLSDKAISDIFEHHEQSVSKTPIIHLEEKKESPKKTSPIKKQKKEKRISFDFNDEDLTKIINLYAAKKGINIVLPQGENAIKTKITLDQKKKITLDEAEKYLYSLLDIVGYGVYPNNDFYVIAKKTDATMGREPITLYVNVSPEDLPKKSEPIRAIYYLTNFQVPKNTSDTNSPLNTILKDMIGDKRFLFDEKSNAIILTANADKIASVMTIILALDATGASEIVEVFPLFYADANIVADLLQKQIIAMANKQAAGAGRVQIKGEAGVYFTPNTLVKADGRTNSLILIGTESAVTRIKSFVRESIDVPLASGRSILHLYDLQYLDAKEFAGVLEQIVKQNIGEQSEKNRSEGPQRFFEDVIIKFEEMSEATEAKDVGGSAIAAIGKVTLGGNRLLISAKNDDWLMIKHLIEKLDKPQLQVIIEVMILDITLNAAKILNSQLRNPVGNPIHQNMQYQTVNIASSAIIPGVAPGGTAQSPMISLTADLLELLQIKEGNSIATGASSGGNIGSMIISFKDPCQDAVWAAMQIFNKWGVSNVISHPFIVTKNNVKGRENLVTIRRGYGRNVSSGGNVTVKVEDYPAKVSVEITPRISSLDRLNMQIRVEVSNFTSPIGTTSQNTDFTTTNRIVETNATMSAGQVLILGGLTQDTETETETKWPLLGDIPVIGPLFFRGATKSKIKNNLAIIVHPTIVNPKLRAGQQKHTQEKIETRRKEMEQSGLFNSLKDPVTRLFFADMGNNGIESLDEYLIDVHYTTKEKENAANLEEQKAFDASFKGDVVHDNIPTTQNV